MPQLEEYSFLIELDQSGVTQIPDAAAIGERIREWIATPEGSVSDLPGWGNQLARLKFEPTGIDRNVLAEMLITEKLPIDVKDMVLRGVLVEFKDIDIMYLYIDYGIGTFEGDAQL